jgi:hypothetical protein
VAESGLLAGWEVELPTKTVGGMFTKREALVVTSLPPGLAKVMGEAEYQEQVVAIRELTEAHSKRLLRLKMIPALFLVIAMVLAVFLPLVCAIPMLAGWISEDGYTTLIILVMMLMALSLPGVVIVMGYAYYRAGMAGKTMGYEISRATAHWEARGIAWRLKTSNPLAAMSGGKHPTVIATYQPRVRPPPPPPSLSCC